MTPTPTITKFCDKIHLTLDRIRDGQRVDHWDRDNLSHQTVLLIWHLTHDPDYLASDPNRPAPLETADLRAPGNTG